MKKRPCKHCGVQVYLQYIPVTSSIKWVSFDTTDGKLHDCSSKPLDFGTKKLIQEAVDRMNYKLNTSPEEEISHNLDTIIQKLKHLRQDIIKLS